MTLDPTSSALTAGQLAFLAWLGPTELEAFARLDQVEQGACLEPHRLGLDPIIARERARKLVAPTRSLPEIARCSKPMRSALYAPGNPRSRARDSRGGTRCATIASAPSSSPVTRSLRHGSHVGDRGETRGTGDVEGLGGKP